MTIVVGFSFAAGSLDTWLLRARIARRLSTTFICIVCRWLASSWIQFTSTFRISANRSYQSIIHQPHLASQTAGYAVPAAAATWFSIEISGQIKLHDHRTGPSDLFFRRIWNRRLLQAVAQPQWVSWVSGQWTPPKKLTGNITRSAVDLLLA